MITRWAPFVNRRRPLLEAPSWAAKWSRPPLHSSGCVLRSALGYRGFIGSVFLGSSMPPLRSLPALFGVRKDLRRRLTALVTSLFQDLHSSSRPPSVLPLSGLSRTSSVRAYLCTGEAGG